MTGLRRTVEVNDNKEFIELIDILHQVFTALIINNHSVHVIIVWNRVSRD